VLSGRELVTHAIAEFVNAVGEIFAGFFAASWSEQHPDTHPDPDSYEQSGCSAHSMVIFATNRFCGTAYTPGGLAIRVAGGSSKVVSCVAQAVPHRIEQVNSRPEQNVP
jgi:hypothetical protein